MPFSVFLYRVVELRNMYLYTYMYTHWWASLFWCVATLLNVFKNVFGKIDEALIVKKKLAF